MQRCRTRFTFASSPLTRFPRARRSAVTLSGTALFLLGGAGTAPVRAQDETPLPPVPAYRFVDLGTINNLYTTATGINDRGEITGTSHDGTNGRAYRITPLDTDGDGEPDTWFQGTGSINGLMSLVTTDSTHPYSESFGINNHGELAGQALGTGYTTPQNGFFWGTDLAGIKLSNSGSWAWDINDRGSAAGDVFPTKGGVFQTIWRRGSSGSFTATTIPRPTGFTEGHAEGLNNHDEVVGYMRPPDGGTAAYVWLPAAAYGASAGTKILPLLPGDGTKFANARDINDSGVVAGYATAPGTDIQAALWTPGEQGWAVRALTGFGPWRWGEAQALNNPASGEPLLVVGKAQDAAYETRAFVWDSKRDAGGGPRDLNVLTVNPPQGALDEARAVSRGGLIVGYFSLTTRNGNKSPIRGFLLVPGPTLPGAAAAPSAPSAPAASESTAGQAAVSWTDNAGSENGFKISRTQDAAGKQFLQIGWTPADSVSFTDTFEDQSYRPAYRYVYRVSAFNTAGYSVYATTELVTQGAPLPPSGVTLRVQSAPIRVRLTWTNNSNTQDSIDIERSSNGEAFEPPVSLNTGSETAYEDATASPNTTYSYRLRVHSPSGGYSPYSATVTVKTPRK